LSHSIEYNIGPYQFTINYWFLILFLLVQTGLNELGFWQIARAKEKQVFLDKISRIDDYKILDLETISQSDIKNYMPIQLQVESNAKKSILVENVIQNGKLGYQVLSLVTDKSSHKQLLINRGWIAGRANRNDIPDIESAPYNWTISGRLFPIHQQVLSGQAVVEIFPRLVRIPVLDISMIERLEKQFGGTIEPYLIRISADTKGHFDILWNWVSMPPEKHLGYAFQWFGLSLTFLIISLFALVKKRKVKN